jgi:lysophospholipase L1-like esterase
LQVETLLARYPRIDAILLLVGLNDLALRITQDADYVPSEQLTAEGRARLVAQAFREVPRRYREHTGSTYQNTELWRALWKVRVHFEQRRNDYVQDEQGAVYAKWRERRQHASRIRDDLPDLKVALQEYAANIERIIDLAVRRGVRPVFLTQPAMWRPDLPPHLDRLLWFGGVGGLGPQPGEYYSVRVMDAALAIYNRTLLEICTRRGVECLDLAAQVPRDTTVFYDDVHFNEGGARLVAQNVANFLIEGQPLAAWRHRLPVKTVHAMRRRQQ